MFKKHTHEMTMLYILGNVNLKIFIIFLSFLNRYICIYIDIIVPSMYFLLQECIIYIFHKNKSLSPFIVYYPCKKCYVDFITQQEQQPGVYIVHFDLVQIPFNS